MKFYMRKMSFSFVINEVSISLSQGQIYDHPVSIELTSSNTLAKFIDL